VIKPGIACPAANECASSFPSTRVHCVPVADASTVGVKLSELRLRRPRQ